MSSNTGYTGGDATLNQALPNGGMQDPETHKGFRLSPSTPTDAITSGMNVLPQIPAPTAEFVNGNELDGDRNGDTRTKSVADNFSTDFAKNAPCPREPVRQSQITSSKLLQVPTRALQPATGYSEASRS